MPREGFVFVPRRQKLPRLLDVLYTPAELAGEIGFQERRPLPGIHVSPLRATSCQDVRQGDR